MRNPTPSGVLFFYVLFLVEVAMSNSALPQSVPADSTHPSTEYPKVHSRNTSKKPHRQIYFRRINEISELKLTSPLSESARRIITRKTEKLMRRRNTLDEALLLEVKKSRLRLEDWSLRRKLLQKLEHLEEQERHYLRKISQTLIEFESLYRRDPTVDRAYDHDLIRKLLWRFRRNLGPLLELYSQREVGHEDDKIDLLGFDPESGLDETSNGDREELKPEPTNSGITSRRNATIVQEVPMIPQSPVRHSEFPISIENNVGGKKTRKRKCEGPSNARRDPSNPTLNTENQRSSPASYGQSKKVRQSLAQQKNEGGTASMGEAKSLARRNQTTESPEKMEQRRRLDEIVKYHIDDQHIVRELPYAKKCNDYLMSGALVSDRSLLKSMFDSGSNFTPRSNKDLNRVAKSQHRSPKNKLHWSKSGHQASRGEAGNTPRMITGLRKGNGVPSQPEPEEPKFIESSVQSSPTLQTKRARRLRSSQASPPVRITGPRSQHYVSKVMPMIMPNFPPTAPDDTNMAETMSQRDKNTKVSDTLIKNNEASKCEGPRKETPVPAPMPWKGLCSPTFASTSNRVSTQNQSPYNDGLRQHPRTSQITSTVYRRPLSAPGTPRPGLLASFLDVPTPSVASGVKGDITSLTSPYQDNTEKHLSQEQLEQDRAILENEKQRWKKLMGL
ncbi:hypothetical protein F5X99DRAFT_36429 [Biscogniauxia marginata]|nr:hypothetical protein F5X99DRAFT_36429 [Biscogniauxia marginata]